MSPAVADQLAYLTVPLAEVARRHLGANEPVLAAIYLVRCMHLAERPSWGVARSRQVWLPRRGLVLTPWRALVVEDPTDSLSANSRRGYLAASCPYDQIVALELRSHLLDYGLALVLAEGCVLRVEIEYNGVSEPPILAGVAAMRGRLAEARAASPDNAPVMNTLIGEHIASRQQWRDALAGLNLRQQHAVVRCLAPGETVQAWLRAPAIDESRWRQCFRLAAHEQPAALLVRTDRQILLVKESVRIIRRQATYGTDAWIMPLGHLGSAHLLPRRRSDQVLLAIHLARARRAYSVRLPLPAALGEQARTLVLAPLAGTMASSTTVPLSFSRSVTVGDSNGQPN